MSNAIIAQKSPMLEDLEAGSAIFGVHVAEAKTNRFATVHTKAQDYRRSNTRPLSRRKYFSVVVSKQATRRSVMGRIKPSSQ